MKFRTDDSTYLEVFPNLYLINPILAGGYGVFVEINIASALVAIIIE